MKSVLVFTLILLVGIIFVTDANAISYFSSPFKQMSDGILPENVTCTEVLVIILKSSNGLPSCVKPLSVEKLIQRGWAIEMPSFLEGGHNFDDSLDVSATILSIDDDLQSRTMIAETEIREKAIGIWQYGLDKEQSDAEEEYLSGPTEDGYQIVFYDVSEDQIMLSESPSLPSDLLHWQQDGKKHDKIWNVFAKLIPQSNRNVNQFFITTDGIGAIEGGVNRDINDVSMWNLFYDIADMYSTGIFDEKGAIYTTIHEFGHIVTSDPSQIDVDMELVNSSDKDFVELYNIKFEECFPRVMVVDGCAKNDSYIGLFYQQFWIDIVFEWDEIQYIEDEDEFVEQSDLFYEKYRDRFVSVYSSTNIDEDIAESWTAFVLNDKPLGETMSEQKILFFYNFSELVGIRDHIRKGLV